MFKQVLGLLLLLVAVRPADAQSTPSVVVAGVVQDQTGGILPRASVDLVNDSGIAVQSTTTDDAGTFRFNGVVPGSYELRAAFQGFKPGSERLRVGARPLTGQKLVLALAGVQQD